MQLQNYTYGSHLLHIFENPSISIKKPVFSIKKPSILIKKPGISIEEPTILIKKIRFSS